MESEEPEQPGNGDQVRNVRFFRSTGYDASQVDELLIRIAAELDAGRPAGPLITSAAFRPGLEDWGYATAEVDWYLDQLWRKVGTSEELARLNADPWRDLAADKFSIRPGRPGRMWVHRSRQECYIAGFVSRQECEEAWRDFGLQPGTRLLWVRGELRTAEQQTVVSVRNERHTTLSAGGRTFTTKGVPQSSWPGIAGTIGRDRPDDHGRRPPAHMLPGGRVNEGEQLGFWDKLIDKTGNTQLLDETGTPVLYTGGSTVGHSGGFIKFPDRGWLRFPVRGDKRAHAIMTAVDQAGNKVARYRLAGGRRTVEITIHPDQELTDKLALAIALSAPWLHSRFDSGQ